MRVLLILLIFPLSVFSQTDIEEIRNDSDVVNFIRNVGHEFFPYTKGSKLRDVTFNIYGRSFMWLEKFAEEDVRFADSIMARRWILEDYDGDRLKDLVYYGRIGGSAGIFVFLGGSARKMIILTDGFARWYPHSIEPITIGNTPGIIVGTVEQPDDFGRPKTFAARFIRDTLVYKFGGFAEYNDNVRPGPAFDSIQFRPLSGWGGNAWYITIFKDGSAIYVRETDSVMKDGQYDYYVEKTTGKINTQEWGDLLGYIKFAQLNDSFELKNVSDQTVGLTTVYYSNGTRKTVWDYGMTGTYGLETLYARIQYWIDATQWRVTDQRDGFLFYNGKF